MDFFFENGAFLTYYSPEVMARTIILREQAVFPESTLATTETVYDDEPLTGHLEVVIGGSPYSYSN